MGFDVTRQTNLECKSGDPNPNHSRQERKLCLLHKKSSDSSQLAFAPTATSFKDTSLTAPSTPLPAGSSVFSAGPLLLLLLAVSWPWSPWTVTVHLRVCAPPLKVEGVMILVSPVSFSKWPGCYRSQKVKASIWDFVLKGLLGLKTLHCRFPVTHRPPPPTHPSSLTGSLDSSSSKILSKSSGRENHL